MKVAVFTKSSYLSEIENDINEWIERQCLGPADILRVEQSQSSNQEGDRLIISVWYIPHQQREFPTLKETMNQCPHCGAGAEVSPPNHDEKCPF